jgi:ribosomal protein S18 acetylase RimI-like enzyme
MAKYLQDSFPEERVAAETVDPDTVFLIVTTDMGELAGYCKLYFRGSPPTSGGEDPTESSPGGREPSPSAPSLGSVPYPRIPVKLWRLYTAREWQSRGVGMLLLQHAVAIARKRGGTSLWLTVNKENTGAVRFYERNGFRQIGFTDFDLGGEVHRDFVMEMELGIRC